MAYEYSVRVGFIGPGLMGSHMIHNLAAAGHEVRVFARTPTRATGLPASLAESVAAAVDGCDVACSMVTDSADVAEVVDRVLATDAPPPLMIDFSTIAPSFARDLAARASAVDIAYLDAPVSGGPAGAEAGSLAIMVGGEADALEQALPILDVVGDPAKRVHCGPVGSGLVVKLVNNLLVGVISAATSEAFGIGQRAGVPLEVIARAVGASSGGSWWLENMLPGHARGEHEPGFKVRDLRKDLGHARDLAEGELRVAAEAIAQFEGIPGELDYGAVTRRFLDLPGENPLEE